MCSYCGCKDIELIGRYMEEHDQLINELGVLRRACDQQDLAAVQAACQHLAGLMQPHFDSEERSLFAVLREDEDFTEHVDDLCSEHEDLWVLFDAVKAGDFGGYKAFEDRLRVHMDREDNGLFPAAAVSLDGPSWDRIMELA
ncbi:MULTISPECIES: hemerythrin domain-containing protein [Arsenicicoccus]|uniref:Hemerythrin domain-containing protein n=2 Tax=Arsenicicoccus bolidensis TaxID=229480 RepID=A0ABS9Q533_9MICO|nr:MULTISPECIES: hemerythrin domain-containing protein [Arsenicicoccus]MCG7322991.1 hemerythrin domain-containing protein [Arsenicicoccus bolidensis]